MDSLTNYERWCNWMILEHGGDIEPSLKALWDRYNANRDKFISTKLYWGIGYDADQKKYADWDRCDVRDITGCISWDVLMGLPYVDASMDVVKNKLSLGMMTWNQVKFMLYETARVLKVGGIHEATFRDFDRLLDRRDELDPSMFVRYIYGSSLYYGSRRRSCWTRKWLTELSAQCHLEEVDTNAHGMNTRVTYRRVEGNLRRFTPEPVVHRNADGSVRNEADDFHYDKVGK